MSETSVDLDEPICAGASVRFYAVCPRCGATMHNACRDDLAYTHQHKINCGNEPRTDPDDVVF